MNICDTELVCFYLCASCRREGVEERVPSNAKFYSVLPDDSKTSFTLL